MNGQKQTYRCCIAGGGPSGIMLGYLLARARIEVVVLEKHADFFRDFRGDTIHPSTMEVLRELGLFQDFLKQPHDKVDALTAEIGGELFTLADFSYLSGHIPFIAFTPQWHFLNFLSEKGKAFSRFHLLMEHETIDIIQENGQVVGVKAKTKNGTINILADVVIGADGRHSTVREKANFKIIDSGSPMDVLWFKLPKHDDHKKRPFGLINNGKWLIMIDRTDYWQCAFIILKGQFEHWKQSGLEHFRREVLTLASFTEKSIRDITDWDQVKLLSVKVDHLERWHRAGLLCIGDAAHAMSPIGGVGINLAIQDAVAAANVLIPAFRNGKPNQRHFAQIQKRRMFPTRMTQRFQVLMQNRVLLPYMQSEKPTKPPFALKLFNWFPFLRWLPARFVGVGVRAEHIRSDLFRN